MDSPEKGHYEVVISSPAELAFYEILEYLFEYYPFERAQQLAFSLRNLTKSLSRHPQRGAIEERLKQRSNVYRFILFKRTSRADIKIIYFIDENERKVYVTDFFPTERNDKRIK